MFSVSLTTRRITGSVLLALPMAFCAASGRAAVTPPARLALAEGSLPDAYIGYPYHTSILITGGSGRYTTYLTGAVADGLTARPNGIVVSIDGVPASSGTFNLHVIVRDVDGTSVSGDYPLEVHAQTFHPDSGPPEAYVTDAETFHLTDTDAVFFPLKLTDAETFHLTDTDSIFFPTQVVDAEVFHLNDTDSVFFPVLFTDAETFHLTDSSGFLDGQIVTDAETFYLTDTDTVTAKVGVSPATAPAGTYNASYSQVFTAAGNTGTATLTPSGTVPGLSFYTSGSTTTLSGTPTTPGTYSFTITAHDTANTSVVSYSLTINPASQTINVGTLPSPTYGGAAFSLTGDVTASSDLAPSITLNSGPVTGSGNGPYTITGAGTASFTATQAGNANYISATPVNFNVSIAPATLTLQGGLSARVFDQPNPTFGYTYASNFVNGDSSSVVSGMPAITTTATPISPVSGSPYPIVLSLGTLSAANYVFSFINGPLYIFPTSQTITFYPLPNLAHGTTFPLSARSSSGLGVTYSVSGPASVSGNILTVTGTGTVQVTAAQAGNSNYYAATSVVRSFTAQ